MASANDRQEGGTHYRAPIQHWDYVIANNLGYLEGQITKYVTRWRKKNGLEDLKKARHFLDKLIEEVTAGRITKEEPPIPPDAMKPTGWVGFTYEATKDGQDLYRCKACRLHFSVPLDTPPLKGHPDCGAEPASSYVDQDKLPAAVALDAVSGESVRDITIMDVGAIPQVMLAVEQAHCALVNFDNFASMNLQWNVGGHPVFGMARIQLVGAIRLLGREVS